MLSGVSLSGRYGSVWETLRKQRIQGKTRIHHRKPSICENQLHPKRTTKKDRSLNFWFGIMKTHTHTNTVLFVKTIPPIDIFRHPFCLSTLRPGFEYNSDGFVRAMSCVPGSLDSQKGGSTGAWLFLKDGANTLKPLVLHIIYILLMEEILHHLGIYNTLKTL